MPLVVSDPNGAIATRYGVFGLPTTVFVSPSGKLLGRHVGQLDAATLVKRSGRRSGAEAEEPGCPAGPGGAEGLGLSQWGVVQPESVHPTALAYAVNERR